jgi:transposase
VKDGVLIAVDPHKAHNALAVLDPSTRTVVAEAEFANSHDGHRQMMCFARRWKLRRWAVEGCHGAGRSLGQFLVASQEPVLDVPAKLAARVRVFSQGHGRKTDRDDAFSIGLAAIDGIGVLELRADDSLVALRLFCDRREELVAARTRSVCRLHRLLCELTPGELSRELSAAKAASVLARVRPQDEVGKVRRALAAQHLADPRGLDRQLKTVRAQIVELVEANGTGLINLFGVVRSSPDGSWPKSVMAAASRPRITLPPTTAPPPSTCPPAARSVTGCPGREIGGQPRHPHDGRHPDPLPQQHGPGLLRTKASRGNDRQGGLRCLKRRLSDVIYRQLVADQRGTIEACGSPTTETPTPPTSASPTRRSPAVTPRPRPARRPGSTRGSHSTGRQSVSSASRSSTPTPSSQSTFSTRRRSSASDRSTTRA